MSESNLKTIPGWVLSAVWTLSACFLWWKIVFDGGAVPVVIDTSVFGVQTLKLDSVTIAFGVVSGVIFLKALAAQVLDSKKQVALALTGVGLVLSAAASQFWFFSLGVFLFILSNIIFFEEAVLRNLLSLVILSVVGVAIEPYFSQAPQWSLLLFFIFFLIFAFRAFPNAIMDNKSKEVNTSLSSWVLQEAPAIGAALFFVKRAPQVLDEQSALILKSTLIVFSFLGLLRSYQLSERRLQEQSFLGSLLLICVFSINLPNAIDWAPALICSFSLGYFICRLGLGVFEKMRWFALVLILFMASPGFTFGHTFIASTQSEEFLKTMLTSVIILSLLGLNAGVAFASSIEAAVTTSTKTVLSVICFLFVLMSLQFFWTGVWVSEKDISLLSNEGSWAPLSIFVVTAATTLLAHRAIRKILSEFGRSLNFQDEAWSGSLVWLSQKGHVSLVWTEEVVFKNGVSFITGKVVQWVADVWVTLEEKVVKGSTEISRTLSTKTIHWWQEKQTSDGQYYLIFGIGTVALLLLHFLVNAQL